MSKRGPRPVPSKGLRRVVRQIHDDLKELDSGRRQFDRKYYLALKKNALETYPPLSQEAQTEFDEQVAQIRDANLSDAQKRRRIDNLQDWTKAGLAMPGIDKAARASYKRTAHRREVIDALLEAETVAQVREICEAGFRIFVYPTFDPILMRTTSVTIERELLGEVLIQHAESFLAGKQERKFPKSSYAGNRGKQLWFLARVLAGAVYGIKPRTSIDRLPKGTRNA